MAAAWSSQRTPDGRGCRFLGWSVDDLVGWAWHQVWSSGWGLLEMRPMRMSLEEIFLHVTTEEAPATAAAAEEVVQ